MRFTSLGAFDACQMTSWRSTYIIVKDTKDIEVPVLYCGSNCEKVIEDLKKFVRILMLITK
jgi:hypothetical protein